MYRRFEEIEKEDAFILGYIDGDGCIQHKIKPRIEILGTLDFLNGIAKRFKTILNKEIKYIKPLKNSKVFSMILHGDNARKIFTFYSAINVPKLERKWTDVNNLYERKNICK